MDGHEHTGRAAGRQTRMPPSCGIHLYLGCRWIWWHLFNASMYKNNKHKDFRLRITEKIYSRPERSWLSLPWHASEASTFRTVRGKVPLTLPVERSSWGMKKRPNQTKYITPKQIVHTIVHHRTLVHRKTEKKLAYLNLLLKILLSDKIKRYISENSFVKASLSKNSETVNSFTSAIGFITDGLPRLSSLLSFSIKHNGTFPTNTFRSAAREKWTSRPKLLRCGWQDL